MKLTLAENIRTLRKQKKLTQEKLAEALGVTVGAVYKWESGLSQPELGMLVELADFFDTSVDVLIGYKMKDNRLESTMERLGKYAQTLDPSLIQEAEKALAKYPHSFNIVYSCAMVYLVFGGNKKDKSYLRRAEELLEQSIVLSSQNEDPHISQATISGDMSLALFLLDEREKGLELLKKNNAGGIFDSEIGVLLSLFMDRPEEAEPYLSGALMSNISSLLNVICAYVFLFRKRKDWRSALAITTWGVDVLSGLLLDKEAAVMDKVMSELLILKAYAEDKSGRTGEMDETLLKAKTYAARFDATPDYSLDSIRFVDRRNQTLYFDIFGETASGSIAALLDLLADQKLTDRWQEICGHGE